MQSAAKECLATSGGQAGHDHGTVAGWAEHVKPYANESKFWASIWQSLGYPSEGEVFLQMKNSKRQYKYAVRRLKKVNGKIKNDKFVTSALKGGGNISTEIKKLRGTSSSYSSRIDDEVGQKNIATHFANIHTELYNRVRLDDKLENISNQINSTINSENSAVQITRVNERSVGEALKVMKANKHDALYNIVSDCLINGPPELLFHLTQLLKLFVSHGSVPNFILICTLMPLVKDNLGDITQSDNYRAIAGGSLLLKLLDILILQLEGDKLEFDQLQFAYQSKSSTTMYSWMVTFVVVHFNKMGTAV